MAVKAIETRYAGCRFRSRLEARWAVFFDALGIEWNYEPQGFETQHGRYLPDFWLPETKAWIEVKGGKPTKRDANASSQPALVLRSFAGREMGAIRLLGSQFQRIARRNHTSRVGFGRGPVRNWTPSIKPVRCESPPGYE